MRAPSPPSPFPSPRPQCTRSRGWNSPGVRLPSGKQILDGTYIIFNPSAPGGGLAGSGSRRARAHAGPGCERRAPEPGVSAAPLEGEGPGACVKLITRAHSPGPGDPCGLRHRSRCSERQVQKAFGSRLPARGGNALPVHLSQETSAAFPSKQN